MNTFPLPMPMNKVTGISLYRFALWFPRTAKTCRGHCTSPLHPPLQEIADGLIGGFDGLVSKTQEISMMNIGVKVRINGVWIKWLRPIVKIQYKERIIK